MDIIVYNKNNKKTKVYSSPYIINYHLINEKIVNMWPCDTASMIIDVHDLSAVEKYKGSDKITSSKRVIIQNKKYIKDLRADAFLQKIFNQIFILFKL